MPTRTIMISEKLATACGVLVTAIGSFSAFLTGMRPQLAPSQPVRMFADVDPSDVSTWILTAANALTVLGGVCVLVFTNLRKARRDAILADDEVLAKTRDAKITDLTEKLDLASRERDLFRTKLEVIQLQNEKQTEAIARVGADVIAVGKQLNTPMSSDEIPTHQPEPA